MKEIANIFDFQLGRVRSSQKGYLGTRAFSLTELLIVIVIVGILALLAIPRFMGVTTRAKMTEAKLALKQVHTLQMAHRYEFDRYSEDLASVGYEPNHLVTEGGSARYVIAVESADVNTFMASATSVVDFDGDGVFNVWEVDETGDIRQRVAD